MRGTVHRTCLNSVKTKKIFLGCEEPRKIFLQVALWPVLTLYKRPVCCVDTQLASELLSANFLFWKPGTARREERFMNEYRIYLFDRNGKRQYDHVQARNAQEAADIIRAERKDCYIIRITLVVHDWK